MINSRDEGADRLPGRSDRMKKNSVGQILRAVRYLYGDTRSNPNRASLFDERWYLQANPDVAASKVPPLEHYLKFGYREKRAPNALFDPEWYLRSNPDVAAAGLEPVAHYLMHGHREGRSPHPLFDGAWYLQQYPDVRNARLNPLGHFVAFGAGEGRRPSPLFDPSWYLRQTGEVDAKANPVGHYLLKAPPAPLSPIPLFDSGWYLKQYSDVREAGMNPLVHYISYGATEGRNPNVLFDTQWYLRQAGIEASRNPLLHYITVGAARGFSPHPFFDANWYLRRYPDAANSGDALSHYFAVGQNEGRSPHPSFDPTWYIERPNAKGVSLKDALEHYLTIGLPQGFPGSFEFQASPGEASVRTSRTEARKPTVLMVTGTSNSAIDIHVYELCSALAPAINSLILRDPAQATHELEVYDFSTAISVRFNSVFHSDDLLNFLRSHNIIQINIHSAKLDFYLLDHLRAGLKVPYDITLHDYSLFSEEPDLAGADKTFIGEKNIKQLEAFSSSPSAQDIIANARKILAPSQDMAARINRLASVENIVITPHLSGFPETKPLAPVLLPGRPLNIAVIGHLTEKRGLQTVIRVGQLAAERSAPIRIILIGSMAEKKDALAGLPIVAAGDYVRGQLPEILRENEAHLIWYPSQVPEAFAHTLSEGLWTGLPLLVPDLGAFPERVAGRPWSFIAKWNNTPADWLASFKNIRESILLHLTPEVSERQECSYVQNFYKSGYISF